MCHLWERLYEKVKPFSGTHTVWNGIVPDFTLEEPRELFREHFMKHHIGIGSQWI